MEMNNSNLSTENDPLITDKLLVFLPVVDDDEENVQVQMNSMNENKSLETVNSGENILNSLAIISIEDSLSYPPTAATEEEEEEEEEEEIRHVQTVCSDMIDKTCSNDPTSNGNIFEHTYILQDSFAFLFRSIVPKQEILKQVSSAKLFHYEDQERMKYTFQVLDRRTNRLIYEQVPIYHKYAMKLLFKGSVQRELLHTNAIINFFARETLRLGEAFDEPKSRKHIPAFVKTYQINLDELLQSNLSSFFTFNEFFYRKLKPNARPIDQPNDPSIINSAADCRLMLFNNISVATRIWIKGHQFSLRYLFEDEKLAREFDGGSIAVFRLAPDDYHRFHSPIQGRIGSEMKQITGTYYTVNPIAIQTNLDVLTRNQRTVITIESDCFEKVAFVAIGVLLVGSVIFTVKPNQCVEKGDELGYFAYGGSTIVTIFKAGMVKWDDDLLHNSTNTMETLVRMGERIGQRTSEEERQEYLSNNEKMTDTRKNSTISQLLSHFPIMNSIK